MDLQYLRDHYHKMDAIDQKLACDLAAKFNQFGSWTEAQRNLIIQMVQRAGKPRPKEISDLSAIHALFDKAARTLKFPKVVLQADDTAVKISRAGDKSRYPGSLNVTSPKGGYHEAIYYGRVGTDNRWRPSQVEQPAGLGELLERFAADPAAVALEYGRMTGNCCFCSKPLTDDISVVVGYGPTCAKKWGLPHNKKAAVNARA